MAKKTIIYISLILGLFISSSAWANVSEWADILIKAHREGQKIPVLSEDYTEINLKTAYLIQKAYIGQRLKDDTIAGFKAGITSGISQKKFGIDVPVAGILLASGKRMNHSIINKSDFNKLMIETEIGFVVEKPINHPLKTVSELYGSISAAMPIIELPDVGFEDTNALKAIDIISANVAASHFIVGEERSIKSGDLNNISVTLYLNRQSVNLGKGTDALGDQWEAAFWLVNKILAQGWEIKPGHILITGVLGKMIPGETGEYLADFGHLGKIFFQIK